MKNFTNLLLILLIALATPSFLFAQETTLNSIGAGSKRMLNYNIRTNTNSVEINSPSEISNDSIWLHYDDMDNYDSWGFLISGEEYDVVAKWDPSNLTGYDGWEITKIKFIVVNVNPYLTIKVWEGPNTTEIYSQEVNSFNVSTWTEVELDTPVAIDITKELWVGYHVDMTHIELGGIVTATDDGPPEDEYGNLYRWNGTWYSDFNNHNLQVYLKANLNADFEADNTTVCMGSTVNFTNLSTAEDSYLWTFEGGTPATSTDENPSVVYSTPGEYDVTLEVSLGDQTNTEYKQDYIHVLDIPGQADAPDGESSVCTDHSYTYTTNEVQYAQDYEWELSPADAGTLSPDGASADLNVASDWTGDFTIRVRATNLCDNGAWSDYLEGTVYSSPEIFNLIGGGGYCLNGDGVDISLDNSQVDVDYELYLDGIATGNIVAGTGAEISFGLLTDEGYYSSIANNSNCDATMSNQVEVSILYTPLEPAQPTGPEVICEEETSDYESEGSDDADSYGWILSPDDAGTITSNGLTATVEWNAGFSGTAYISLYGINECGDGNPSTALEVSVGSPNPVIEGEEMVCDWSDEVYEVVNNEGSTYTWQVTGGSISEGQGTNLVTVSWEGVGSGTLMVSEETADGCAGDSEMFEVLKDDCTGMSDLYPEKFLAVSPNPVNHGVFKINTGTSSPVKIKIMSTRGIVVSEFQTNNKFSQVNCSDYPSGVYLLKATYENQKESVIKFLKY